MNVERPPIGPLWYHREAGLWGYCGNPHGTAQNSCQRPRMQSLIASMYWAGIRGIFLVIRYLIK